MTCDQYLATILVLFKGTQGNWALEEKKLSPISTIDVQPPKMMTGDSAICAFLTAVIVLVTPGPAVQEKTHIETKTKRKH